MSVCKFTLVFLLYSVFYLHATAQFAVKPCSKSAQNCSLDLRDSMYTSSQIGVLTRSYGIESGKTKFKDVLYSEEICTGAPKTTCILDDSILKYDVYYPTDHNYKTCPLPAVLYFHGGNFLDCNGYNADEPTTICREMAKRGFVVFNVEYRRGVIFDVSFNLFTAQQMLAVYRAMQDARGAIRSICKRQRNANSFNDPYAIDVNNMFVTGSSAGGMAMLSTAYFQSQDMFDAIMPGMRNALGPVDVDYYYAESTTTYKIKGVGCLWSGMLIPPSYIRNPSAFFAKNTTMPPVIAFNGTGDSTFNMDSKPIYFPTPKDIYPYTNTHMAMEDRCIAGNKPYTLTTNYPNPNLYLIGSRTITQIAGKNKSATELYLDTTLGHSLEPLDQFPQGDGFGTHLSEASDVLVYITQRISTFFQAIINDKTKDLHKSSFLNCENYRHGCNTDDDYANCDKTHGLQKAVSADQLAVPKAPQSLANQHITAYPNPAAETISLSGLTTSLKNQVTILDAQGKIYITQQATAVSVYSIHLKQLAAGIYYVMVQNSNGTETLQFIKK